MRNCIGGCGKNLDRGVICASCALKAIERNRLLDLVVEPWEENDEDTRAMTPQEIKLAYEGTA